MKIVIDVPDKVKEMIDDNLNACDLDVYDCVMLATRNGTPLPKCNECKYYEGVHKVQGHAPCSYHTIGGVMWDWYCSQFEADKESKSE